jgi:predicted lipid carrier protein YhbT
MAATTMEFFESLGQQGHVPSLETLTGRLRWELTDGDDIDRWLVTVDHGDVAVSRRGGKADCVIQTDTDVFEGIATGRVNAVAAVFRGLVGIEGDLNALVLFQRVFPGPPHARARKKGAAQKGGRS